MIIQLPEQIKQHRLMFLLSLFCIALLLVRAKITHSLFFFFLVWNLFLAFTPLALTWLFKWRVNLIIKPLYFYLLLALWLLLLPNAPYLITDLVHLKREGGIPVWFDVLLLVSFSVCGLLFGLASMKNVYNILTIKYSTTTAKTALVLTSFLCGFGIYVGRFLHYNSWDILQKPFVLGTDIICSLTDTDTYRAAWGITLGFGTLLYLLFSLYNDHER